jgi:hypothetical protein
MPPRMGAELRPQLTRPEKMPRNEIRTAQEGDTHRSSMNFYLAPSFV